MEYLNLAKKKIAITDIYPSLLAADCMRLGEEIHILKTLGIDTLHLDIMDNHYVPNLSFGPHIARQIKKKFHALNIDVHLMATPVDALIASFAEAGAYSISIHPETTHHLDRSLALIRSFGCRAGLVLNPATPITYIPWCKHRLDFILVMTVNPGFGGQIWIPETINKIKELAEHYPDIELVVDGGVDAQNIQALAQAGARKFIVGSALFHSSDYQTTLNQLCQL
jgi:ribulose-phosphate 3-epimerase